ncbi:hypothetical protein H4R99_008367, partial [Coemansia sp. RSA 1722]
AHQTLARFLHKVAHILCATSAVQCTSGETGPQAASQQQQQQTGTRALSNGNTGALFSSSHSADLESVLCLFLIDAPEIKMGALRHLGDTLTWLTAASRVRCLPMIVQVFKHNGKQWHTHELMARQLVKLCHLFPASIVVGSLLPQAVEWAHDPVAGVRAAVAPAFPIVFELTKLDPSTQVKFFETVISFSHAATFRGRLFSSRYVRLFWRMIRILTRIQLILISFFAVVGGLGDQSRGKRAHCFGKACQTDVGESHAQTDSVCPTIVGAVTATADNGSEESLPTMLADKNMRRKTSEAIGSSSSTLENPSALPKPSGNEHNAKENSRFNAHRSLGSVARRPRRNTTPMRAHLLAMMVQQLAKDTDRDVLDLVRDLPGMPISTPIVSSSAQEDSATFGLGIVKKAEALAIGDSSVVEDEEDGHDDNNVDVFLDVEAEHHQISAISCPITSSSMDSQMSVVLSNQ